MPNWNTILNEINSSKRKDAFDYIRRKYILKLHRYTGRNVIAYYSGWLQKPNKLKASINDEDKNGIMLTVHELDRTLGLDLILHTPGGDIAATESIVNYLRSMFGTDIRAFIPQIAMSAGTMIACSCKEIVMGKQSNIGPIDPQFNGIPCHGVISEFEKAVEEIRNDPDRIPLWQTIIGKYHPTFIGECRNAINWSSKLICEWLESGMFAGQNDAKEKAKSICDWLGNHDESMSHSRHFHVNDAVTHGLKIKILENDKDNKDKDILQDLVLTVHHAYMHTLSNTPALKIIENHKERAMIIFDQIKS